MTDRYAHGFLRLEVGGGGVVGDVAESQEVEHDDLALDPAENEVPPRLLSGLEVSGCMRHVGGLARSGGGTQPGAI